MVTNPTSHYFLKGWCYWLSNKITLSKGSLDACNKPLAGLFNSNIRNSELATEMAQKSRIR